MNSDDVTLLNYKHCHTCGARMDGKDGDGNETPDV